MSIAPADTGLGTPTRCGTAGCGELVYKVTLIKDGEVISVESEPAANLSPGEQPPAAVWRAPTGLTGGVVPVRKAAAMLAGGFLLFRQHNCAVGKRR